MAQRFNRWGPSEPNQSTAAELLNRLEALREDPTAISYTPMFQQYFALFLKAGMATEGQKAGAFRLWAQKNTVRRVRLLANAEYCMKANLLNSSFANILDHLENVA